VSVERSERAWVTGFAIVVIVLTTIPYWLGFQVEQAQPDWRYSGLLFATEDANSYIAKMLTGASGSWLFRTPYTAYPQRGMLAFVPYILLGKLAAPPEQHGQLVVLFHVFRIVGVFLMTFASYDFIGLFIEDIRLRRFGTAAAILGGGLGWLAVFGLGGLWSGSLPGMDIPLEYYSPETFGFLSVLGLPHLTFARAFLLWSLCGYLRGQRQDTLRERIKPGVLAFMVGLMQPLTVVVTWAVLFIHLAVTAVWNFYINRMDPNKGAQGWGEWQWYFKKAAWIVLISAPLVVYTFLAFRLDPLLRAWEGQNWIASPPIHHYLLAYGLMLPFAWAGGGPLLKENPWKGWLVVGWVAAFPVLAYAPYTLQRRLPEAVWVALLVLTLKGIEVRGGIWRQWGLKFLGLSFFTTIIFYLGALLGVLNPQLPLYLPADTVKGFYFLEKNARSGSVVLAAFETSNMMPAWAPVRTLVGNGPESIHLKEVLPRVHCFYQLECTDEERIRLLREFQIRYVFWGPAELALGSWNPSDLQDLRLVYQQGTISIFEVQPLSLVK
jgi:hypothetical protein